MKEIIKKIQCFYNKQKNKFLNTKIVKFYEKNLYKPFKFISTAISWSVFVLLLLCAIFLVYYYFSMQRYAKKGAGYEPSYALYTIISGSMYPTIEVYDVVFVLNEDDPSKIKVGDIISYNSSSFVANETISVTHRVVEVTVDKDNNYTYYTKGDNNLSKDPKGVTFNQITGKVGFKIPQLGRLQFFLASKVGWFLVIILPALFIIIKYIVQLVNIPKIIEKLSDKKIFLPLIKRRKLLTYNENEKIDIVHEEVTPVILKKEIIEKEVPRNIMANYVKEDESVNVTEIVENNKQIVLEKEVNKVDDKIKGNLLEKQDINLDMDDIFEDLKNLTK